MHIALAILLNLALAYHGLRKKSLSKSGALAACAVGMLTFTHPWFLFSMGLLTFYLTSSRLTKVGAEKKKKIEESYVEGGQRTAIQVLSNGLNGALLAAAHHFYIAQTQKDMCGSSSPSESINRPLGSFDALNMALLAAYTAHYACCNGDTWASELGVLSSCQSSGNLVNSQLTFYTSTSPFNYDMENGASGH
jgi:uncharacterized membrane protein